MHEITKSESKYRHDINTSENGIKAIFTFQIIVINTTEILSQKKQHEKV